MESSDSANIEKINEKNVNRGKKQISKYIEGKNVEDEETFGGEDLFSEGSCEEEMEAEEVKYRIEKSENKKKTETDKAKKKKSQRIAARLNFTRLNGPNGLKLLKNSFTDFKFRGDNYEPQDLSKIIQVMKNWMCYQLFPKYSFFDTISELEHLGSKKEVQVLLKKMRLGMDEWGEQTIVKSAKSNNISDECQNTLSVEHDFDLWWKEQMIQGPNNSTLENNISNFKLQQLGQQELPMFGNNSQEIETVASESFVQTSFPQEITLTEEQLERISRNKKLAEERKLQRLAKEVA